MSGRPPLWLASIRSAILRRNALGDGLAYGCLGVDVVAKPSHCYYTIAIARQCAREVELEPLPDRNRFPQVADRRTAPARVGKPLILIEGVQV